MNIADEDYIAYAEDVVRADGHVSALFSCLRGADLRDFATAKRMWREQPFEVSIVYFEDVSYEDLRARGVSQWTLAPERWFCLSRGTGADTETGIPAVLSPLVIGGGEGGPAQDEPEEDLMMIGRVSHLPARSSVVQNIRSLVSMGIPGATLAPLTRTHQLWKALDVDYEAIEVYNVGQGNCNALFSRAAVPVAYVDVGMGCFWNRHTVAGVPRLCTTSQPAVILSHWDADHYYIAQRDRGVRGLQWLAPEPGESLMANRVAMAIARDGNLTLWPRNVPLLDPHSPPFRSLTLARANGGNRNNNGIVAVTRLGSSVQGSTSRATVLLPGDANYDSFFQRCFQKEKMSGIIATHHGSRHCGAIPMPAGSPGTVIYSYGRGNRYRHPHEEAVSAHLQSRWAQRLDTTGGSIRISPIGGLFTRLCNLRGCDIQPVQAATLPVF